MNGRVAAMSLSDLLGGGGSPRPPRPLPEAILATLREYADRARLLEEYEVGDVVTLERGCGPEVWVGEPMVITMVKPERLDHLDNESTGTLLVVFMDEDGDIIERWIQAGRIVRWTPEKVARR